MKVLKFGGSSLKDAERFLHVAKIIAQYAQSTSLATVVSAPKGITNDLIALTENIQQVTEDNLISRQKAIEKKLLTIMQQVFLLFPEIQSPEEKTTELAVEFERLMLRLNKLSQGAQLLDHCPETTLAQIISIGEKFSVLLLSAIVSSLGHQVSKILPEKFLTTDENSLEPIADLALSKAKFKQAYTELSHLSFMPGFYGVKPNGETTTLGRNGSDYSAAILAVCMEAEICEVWTDVDGVYNCDPNLIKNAKLLEKMTYNEAMELSYFGAKILHPKTILPLLQYDIPCRIKNTLSPLATGTLISTDSTSDELIKAVTNLPDVAMITVSGPQMRGMVGMAARVFSAISQAQISVIMISQSSAEYSISFCVPGDEAKAALKCLNNHFALELSNELLEPIKVRDKLAIITLVGDKMQQQRGIAAKFFTALAQARVNIIALAQDSSERSISAVVRAKRIDDAVKICHQKLFMNTSTIDAIIIGCGTVGCELIAQIQKQQQRLAGKNIELNVVAIANSRQCLLDKDGIDLLQWQPSLAKAEQGLSLQILNNFVVDAQLSNPVIIDCTSSDDIAMGYNDFLASGFHVVTANKKANTADYDYYCQLRRTAQSKKRRFLYDTNVGAGLPVIDNLQGLLRAGDELLKFEGILSGSLSYIFGEIHKGLTLSEATIKARDLGYTEPNPAEDLSGLDVARKALVIAREAGMILELSDVEVESVVPAELAELSADDFIAQLPGFDEIFTAKVLEAEQQNKVLRYVAMIEDKKIKVGIKSVDVSHPLYTVVQGENALALHTQYYQPIPFVIRGYGAGAEVTAAGLFSDLLKTLVFDNDY